MGERVTSEPDHITLHACFECDKTFMKKYSLQRHIKSIHLNIKDIKCQVCHYATSDKSSLDQHIERNHPNFTNFSCHICGFSVFRRVNIEKHYETVHNQTKDSKYCINSEGENRQKTCNEPVHFSNITHSSIQCNSSSNLTGLNDYIKLEHHETMCENPV